MELTKQERWRRAKPIAEEGIGKVAAAAAMLHDDRLFWIAELAEARLEELKKQEEMF